MSDAPHGIRIRLEDYLKPHGRGRNALQPADIIARYLSSAGTGGRFSGRAFDTYGACDAHPDSVTGSDLVAVTFLSMTVGSTRSGITAEAAIALENHRHELNGLLARIDPSVELHQLDEASFDAMVNGSQAPGRRLFELLHEILRDGGSRRPVATHKLIARKRPGLFPIRDSVAASAVGLTGNSEWWRPWWEALRGPGEDAEAADFVRRVERIRDKAGAGHLSVLRTLDILIWMRDRGLASRP